MGRLTELILVRVGIPNNPYACTGCYKSAGRFCFLNNLAIIQPIELKFGILVLRVRGVFLKKIIDLVIGLLRYGSAKANLGFTATQAWGRAAQGYPAWIPH
jgi:hypothetical protein